MENKRFNLGMVVGRFEPIHLGHEKLIDISLNSCNKTALLVTYNKKDENNPYSLDYVMHLISKIYSDYIKDERLKIIPFKNDIEFNQKYGEKLINTVNSVFFQNPDCIVYGSDKNISKCFEENLRENLFEIKICREEYNISATDIRNALQSNNLEFVRKNLDPKIYDEIENLKSNYKNILKKV